jgi:hypothetical protein
VHRFCKKPINTFDCQLPFFHPVFRFFVPLLSADLAAAFKSSKRLMLLSHAEIDGAYALNVIQCSTDLNWNIFFPREFNALNA